MATGQLVRRMGRAAGWAARTGYELVTLLPGAEATDSRPSRRGELPTADAPRDAVRARTAALLDESAEQREDAATWRLYDAVMRSLVPDEVRLLRLLAQGETWPTVDVVERGFLRTNAVLLRHASTVGSAAGVTLTDAVPVYLGRLVAFGLAELGPEERSLATQYEVLLADESVVAATRTARRPRFVRGTVGISPFGARLWRACDPADG